MKQSLNGFAEVLAASHVFSTILESGFRNLVTRLHLSKLDEGAKARSKKSRAADGNDSTAPPAQWIPAKERSRRAVLRRGANSLELTTLGLATGRFGFYRGVFTD